MLLVVLCNCSPSESESLARSLVEERLAACVNVIPGIKSFYRWQGELCADEEHTLLIKTTSERFEEMKIRLQTLHSYDVPEIVALESVDVLDSYLSWVNEQTERP
ncbi:MAG: divalent-cation tolerance protein CutA [Bradymonadaceae bacterium]